MQRLVCFTLFFVIASAIVFGASGAMAENAADESTRRDSELRLLPGRFTLHGPAARHRLAIGWFAGERFSGKIAKELTLESSDKKVVRIDGDVAVAVGNGKATITASAGKSTATAEVVVDGFDGQPEWSFRNHVEPVLAKFGCSTGACHGALAGKGGLKLSLLGYNPVADHNAITREARGRRIELADPGRSLLLMKPTAAVRHKGGVRFDVTSYEYKVLSQWIAAGASPPTDNDPRLERLEVLPQSARLSPGAEFQLVVRAHFSDGRTEDVTDWIRFAATNEAVAKVDQQGKVTIVGHGEGAITAWYLSRIAIANVSSPYPHQPDPGVFANAPRRNFIDALVLKKLKELNLPPSPRSSDAEFLRRVYLDTLGVLPTTDETRAFLADSASDKRDRVIDRLLADSRFVDYWAFKWSDLLLINGKRLRPDAVKSFYVWVRKEVAANTPWDEFARRLVTAQGSSLENGATNFFALHQTPEDMTENVSQAFLGLSLNCARCHNHPLEKWTNDQYYAMANLMARVRAKGWSGDPRFGDGVRTLYVTDSGDLLQPSTGKPQPPTPLDGEPLPLDDPSDRRIVLAKWLTSPENPYFARAIANRVWANFLGVGLVEKVDDLRLSNPASNEELHEAVAQYLVEKKFDLKELMQAILQSETYQRSSVPLSKNREETRFYSRYYPRRMMAEVLLDAIAQTTGVPDEFKKVADADGSMTDTKFYPTGTRAIQLYDSAVFSPFLKTFGRNERIVTCECARSNEPSIVQVLHITNGTTINQKLAAKECRLTALLASGASDDKIIEETYLTTLSRFPTAEERQSLVKLLAETPKEQRREALEDVYWGILSSREFLFHH